LYSVSLLLNTLLSPDNTRQPNHWSFRRPRL
jgi:hypothetical protein